MTTPSNVSESQVGSEFVSPGRATATPAAVLPKLSERQAGQRVGPRRSALAQRVAERLAATEYERFLNLLQTLAPDDWQRPTDCPAWDVRQLACHVLGMAEMVASVRENARQNIAAWRRGGTFIHALTELQVEERANVPPAVVVARFAAAAPRAARGRAGTPGFVRRLRMPLDQPAGQITESWTFGFLLESILTRDTWMHRVDLARATNRPLVLTADHDGVLIADVVQEWAERHGQPYQLALSGPAGGAWAFGDHPPHIQLDAVEFCRILSGRAPGEGLLRTQVPF